jgi:hypothetical protein
MDTSVWDPGADDISRVSAQEDTTVHTGYKVVQIEATIYDDVQWHTGDSIAQRTVGSMVP